MARGLAWGDIRLVAFGGRARTRPALVLTRSSAVPYLNAVTVAPISRTVRGTPTEIVLTHEHGLKIDSAANLDAVQTVAKEVVGRYLGAVPHQLKPRVREALLFALELSDTDIDD